MKVTARTSTPTAWRPQNQTFGNCRPGSVCAIRLVVSGPVSLLPFPLTSCRAGSVAFSVYRRRGWPGRDLSNGRCTTEYPKRLTAFLS